MIPKTSKTLTDGNLERSTGSANVNKRIMILGTAEDGPMYKAVNVSNITDAQSIWGRFGIGSLVKAINEAISGQSASEGTPNITGVRIGGGYSTKAYLDIDESSTTVMKIQALYEGDVYNDIAIMQDSYNNIKILNPKTQTWSVFSYNTDPVVAADCHNVSELADAINADPNLNGILIAESVEKELFYEIQVNSTDSGVVLEYDDNHTKLKLSAIVKADMDATRYLDNGAQDTEIASDGTSADVTKAITTLKQAYAISESGVQEFETNGTASIVLDQMPLDGKSDSRHDTILGVTATSGNLAELANNASGAVGGEAYLRYRQATLGKIDLADASTDATFTIDAPWGIANEVGTWVSVGDAPIAEAVTGLSTAGALNGVIHPVGTLYSETNPLTLEFRSQDAAVNDWHPLDAVINTDYSLSWAAGVLTITLLADSDALTTLFNSANGGSLRVSFDSVANDMSEKSSLTLLQSTGAQFSDYFVRGKEILFGAPVPANLVFRYATIQYYELGSTLEIDDAYEPVVNLIGKSIQPGPGGAAVGTSDVTIGFKYDVSPEMFTLSGTKSLSNGTNGAKLSNAALYDEMKEAFRRLDDQSFDILVVPGAYMDATKTGYNPISGLPQEVNAEFHILMQEFMDEYNGEAMAITSFKPLEGSGINGSITRLDVASRVEKITEVNMSDPLRAANFLVPFEAKSMIAVDVEPIFLTAGSVYTNTGEAWIAGYLSSLASNQSIYIDTIPGAVGLRYSFSEKLTDGTSQLDALSNSRVVAATSGASGIKLTDGPTLAAAGSDYERLTTYWIANEAVAITRAIAKDYLGRASSMEVLQAMDTRLRADLANLVPDKLQAFTFKIKTSPQQRVLGKVEILLILVPVFEIRDISIPVVLKADEASIASAV